MAHWMRSDPNHPSVERGNRQARAAVMRLVLMPWRAWRTHRLRLRLERLDDRMLEDIGLTRAEIRRKKAPVRPCYKV